VAPPPLTPRRGWRWPALVRGIRALRDPARADRDTDDEIRHFLDESAADLEAGGVPPAEARRRARLAWGDSVAIRESVRSSGWEHLAATLVDDVRQGARRLRRSPGFTTVAVLTLAIGVGASTAIFSAVNPILFAPLPYPAADRIGIVLENGRADVSTFAMYRALAEETRTFDALAAMRRWQPALAGRDVPERLEGQRVTSGFFAALGVAPAFGHDFTPDDDRPGAARVAIVADSLWRRRFAADPAIVGSTVRLDDTPYVVAGVMPAAFEDVLAPAAEIWTPLQYDPALPSDGREWGHHLRTIVRLADRQSLASATLDAAAAGRAMIAAHRPETYAPDTQVSIASLHGTLVAGVRPVLVAMTGAVLLVLIIACVNVTNLLLARGAHRRGEFALRAALGAGRARLVLHVLTESVLLAVLSAVAGVVFAVFAVRALVTIAPAALPRVAAIAVDGQVLAFALALATIAGLAFGTLPALEAAGRDPHRDIQDASHRSAGGHGRVRRLLVVAEVALALVLLVGAGLLMRSIGGLLSMPLGFETSDRLSLQLQLAGRRFNEPAAAARFHLQALDAVRRVPGVTAAAATSQLPLSGDRDEYGARFDEEGGRPADRFAVYRYAVSPGYFDTTGIPILRGRGIDEHDRRDAPAVVVISAALAAARFGGDDPIGRRLHVGSAGPFTIVGVAGNVRQASLAATDADAVYLSVDQTWYPETTMSYVVRAIGNPAALARGVEQAIWTLDKDQPIVRVATLSALVEASEAQRRFALRVFGGFAAIALGLAAIGIYGILAGGVSERRREIGLRAALGATRPQIIGLVVGQGLALAAAGAAVGLAVAAFVSRGLSTLLFGVSRLDPVTYGAVVALLALVAAAACAIPAWRAVRIDPSIALRAD
jgi:putative ABC transport system permease protein